MSEPLIEISGLTKVFQRDSVEVRALDRVDMQVFPGDFVCLMGPSGSGKSTLLNIIAGVDRPTDGGVIVAGADLNEMSEDELASWRNHHVGLCLPALQPDTGPHGLRKRRTAPAAHLVVEEGAA